ncbi:MAG: L,D-transpeptidase family protein [Pseudomonadota bacterium]
MKLFVLLLLLCLQLINPAYAEIKSAAALAPQQKMLAQHFRYKTLRFKKQRFRAYSQLKPLYQARNYQPIWTSSDGLNTLGSVFLEVLHNAQEVGLSPTAYPIALIESRIAAQPFAAAARADLEIIISDTFLRYVEALRNGQIHPKYLGKNWRIYTHKPWAVQALLGELINYPERLKTRLRYLAPRHPGYRKLQAALKYYLVYQSHKEDWPRLGAGPMLKKGQHSEQIQILRARLLVSGDLSKTAVEEDATLFDAPLEEAVRHFQKRHGLAADGVVGPATRDALNVPLKQRIEQIRWNLERWRWLSETLPANRIEVNIPDFSLALYKGYQVEDQMRAIVGQKKRETPILQSEIRRLEFNPSWRVPRSITVKDILPELYKNPDYLAARNMTATYDGLAINPQFVKWSEYHENNFPAQLRFEQAPGRSNALGKVKFVMPNCCSIYLHDTPTRGLFKRRKRALSSGCIRIEHPRRLAEHLLLTQKGWEKSSIQRAFKRTKRRSVKILEPMPVFLLYWTAWIDDKGIMHFRDDIYGYDRAMQRILK